MDEPIAMILVDFGQESWYFYPADRLGSVEALWQLKCSEYTLQRETKTPQRKSAAAQAAR